MIRASRWLLVGLALALSGCLFPPTAAGSGPAAGVGRASRQVEQLRVEVLGTYPHDRTAFTQGLVWTGSELYESTGLYGRPSVRRVDLETGRADAVRGLEPQYFGEGLALANDQLIQLTWQEQVAFVYDRASLEPVGSFSYDGEGWGLCFDGSRLIMSDGSATLSFRDPGTFALLGTVEVRLDGTTVSMLNELECVGDQVYANVWQTERILRIHPGSGEVTAEVNAGGLLSTPERVGSDVLNGIAYDADRDLFLITGKLWPWLFEVRFVP